MLSEWFYSLLNTLCDFSALQKVQKETVRKHLQVALNLLTTTDAQLNFNFFLWLKICQKGQA